MDIGRYNNIYKGTDKIEILLLFLFLFLFLFFVFLSLMKVKHPDEIHEIFDTIRFIMLKQSILDIEHSVSSKCIYVCIICAT